MLDDFLPPSLNTECDIFCPTLQPFSHQEIKQDYNFCTSKDVILHNSNLQQQNKSDQVFSLSPPISSASLSPFTHMQTHMPTQRQKQCLYSEVYSLYIFKFLQKRFYSRKILFSEAELTNSAQGQSLPLSPLTNDILYTVSAK